MNGWHSVDSVFLLVKKQTLRCGQSENEDQTVLLNSCSYGTGELYPAFLSAEDAVNFLKKRGTIYDNMTVIQLPLTDYGRYPTEVSTRYK